MNRVKVTYAIDLEEVPAESQRLLNEAVGWLRGASGALEDMSLSNTRQSFPSLGEEAHKIRATLQKVDQRIDDCLTIMAGYHQVTLDLSSPVQEEHHEDHDTASVANALSEQIQELQRQSGKLTDGE